MNRIETISIKGFRRLQNIELEMRNLTVMIGANGSGKTSFLDVMSVLAASASGNLQNILQLKGGLNEILTRGKAQELEIAVSMQILERQSLNYSLTLSPKGLSYEIRAENLTQQIDLNASEPFKYIESRGLDIKYYSQDDHRLLRPNWEHNPLETSLSQVPKMYREPENLRKTLASCTYYGALDVSEKSPIRLPQTMRPAKLPGARGEDLISCLYNLRESDRDRFEWVENILSSAFPDFKQLNFPPVAAGTLSMTWTDRNFDQPIYVHELSEGTLRFLWLVTLLQSQNLTTITLLDEPEVSLHPELLRHLVYLMREASKHTQLIVATHSDRLIGFLEPHEVLICDIEEGEAKMTWADTFNLNKWLEDYSLDQVWAMNIMGGRP
ncbi:ABC transport protein, ATP-binding subunit [Planktothrix tepida]|uniref:ABC transport protein, ATP-binding subunit n=2 Tax=Planktothrix TaxID=54304 RepID=A0A1J1LEW9_9CYAN|nr:MULTISPECIES: AAA family ATPase [Planktothrix]CAD5921561.1 ABC transport protein, ATP-binding subunit [Planktothrix tepida]CAD5982885.1 ABC transport protein, ATP-binding subunit [Planktothrix pseudagardhii]CUR30984.1 ABC transport protein, ATP-binding subunit [Planktothrix tepida PCC 9214]